MLGDFLDSYVSLYQLVMIIWEKRTKGKKYNVAPHAGNQLVEDDVEEWLGIKTENTQR